MLSGFTCLAIDYYQLKLLSSLLSINSFTVTSNRTNFDKESKLLDVLTNISRKKIAGIFPRSFLKNMK